MSAAAATLANALYGVIGEDVSAEDALAALHSERDRLNEIIRLRSEVLELRKRVHIASEAGERMEVVKQEVANAFAVSVEQIDSKCRFDHIVAARHVVFYLVQTLFTGEHRIPLSFISGHTGGRNHGTAIHGRRRVLERMETLKGFKEKVAAVAAVCRKRLSIAPEGQDKLL